MLVIHASRRNVVQAQQALLTASWPTRWLHSSPRVAIARRPAREGKRERGGSAFEDGSDEYFPQRGKGDGAGKRDGSGRSDPRASSFASKQRDEKHGSGQKDKRKQPEGRRTTPLTPTDWSRKANASKANADQGQGNNRRTDNAANGKPRNENRGASQKSAASGSAPAKKKNVKVQKVNISLPPLITVSNLAKVLDVNMRRLQHIMSRSDLQDTRPDRLLAYSDAELLAMELNIVATPLSSTSADFDIYPRTTSSEPHTLPLRPPIVAIMGHVDHGKTTLLDKLRSASVAAGEAGGITQHVGAFSVKVKGMSGTDDDTKAITFLDTPGHAAFSQMRSRGARFTDIVVLVVAADDGVMPQTKEVIRMIQEAQEEAQGTEETGDTRRKGTVQLMIALSKVDRADADPEKVKGQLMGENVLLEEFGGDVPCVEISGKTGAGLDVLQDTLVAISEMNELRAEQTGPAEGYVIESRVERNSGNSAIVLIRRGCLRVGDYCVAGTGWCKVRRLTDSSGQVNISQALPGDAAMVTGWRELPSAGDVLLGAAEGAEAGMSAEEQVKRSVETRKRVQEELKMLREVETINEARRADAEVRAQTTQREKEIRRLQREARLRGESADRSTIEASLQAADGKAPNSDAAEGAESNAAQTKKELRLIVKADVSGTVEAVLGAISGIGNKDVGVRIVSSGIGDPSEGDLDMAKAVGGHIVCFNVNASQALRSTAEKSSPAVQVHCDDVIYRLMTYVSEQCAALLPPRLETRVVGEASIQQVFPINVRGKQMRNVAGCRVTNGVVSRHQSVRVLRNVPEDGRGAKEVRDGGEEGAKSSPKIDSAGRRILYEGKLESLKQVKKEVDEMRKGTECGMSFEDDFQEFAAGDLIQSFYIEKVPQTL